MQIMPASVHTGTGRAAIQNYPLRVILDGVTLFNLGYSLPAAAAKLKSRHGYKVSPSHQSVAPEGSRGFLSAVGTHHTYLPTR